MALLLAFLFPLFIHAEAIYVCVAQCGHVHVAADDTQGVQYIQVVASGFGQSAAFTKLEQKCADLQTQNLNTRDELKLSGGYLLVTGGHSEKIGLFGNPVPAKPAYVCTELPTNEVEQRLVIPTPIQN